LASPRRPEDPSRSAGDRIARRGIATAAGPRRRRPASDDIFNASWLDYCIKLGVSKRCQSWVIGNLHFILCKMRTTVCTE
jgi:hypothetical protein